MKRLYIFIICVYSSCISMMCAPQMYINPPLEYGFRTDKSVEAYINELHNTFKSNNFRLIYGKSTVPDDCTPLFSFIHVSDVQLRDHKIIYFGKTRSNIADKFAGGTQRDTLDMYDEIPYIALIGAINQAERKPRFLLHTGDAIDAGTIGELISFISISNFLKIPWFNVVGNHDVFLFGNFTESWLKIINPRGPGVLAVQSRDYFIKFHGENDFNMHIPDHMRSHHETATFLSPSYRHGFDLSTRDTIINPKNQSGTSHYSVMLNKNPPIRLLVLDTNVPDEMIPQLGKKQVPGIGSTGVITKREFEWLENELNEANLKNEFVFVAGHHPLSDEKKKKILKGNIAGISNKPLLDYLRNNPRVLAYFGGHTHYPYINVYGSFAEVIAPSLHEFPQTALSVTLLRQNNRYVLSICPVRGEVINDGDLKTRLEKSFYFTRKDQKKEGEEHWKDNDPNVHRFIQLK